MKPFFRKIVNYVDANHGFPASTVAQWSPFRPTYIKKGSNPRPVTTNRRFKCRLRRVRTFHLPTIFPFKVNKEPKHRRRPTYDKCSDLQSLQITVKCRLYYEEFSGTSGQSYKASKVANYNQESKR